MPTWERSVDVAAGKSRAALFRLGQELRDARRDRGLSIDAVAARVGISNAEISRIERGLAPRVPFSALAMLAVAVGMDLSARLYPGGPPIRDAPQARLLWAFRSRLHRSLPWSAEVPIAIVGDQRAWDATVGSPVLRGAGVFPSAGPGSSWLYGVEAETLPRDVQALQRRLRLKLRDSQVTGVLLVLPDTRRARDFERLALPLLGESFPVPGARAMELLAAGADPGGGAIIRVVVPTPGRHTPDV